MRNIQLNKSSDALVLVILSSQTMNFVTVEEIYSRRFLRLGV